MGPSLSERRTDEETGSEKNADGSVDGSNISTATIGQLGSVAIGVHSLVGPALLSLPAACQRAGLIPTTITLMFAYLLSSLCALHMANIVSMVPGNRNFQKTVEFSEPFRIFWGPKMYAFTQATFFLCAMSQNVSAIVDTSQVIDNFLGHTIGSVALQFFPSNLLIWKQDACTKQEVADGQCDPFNGDDGPNILLSAGYLVATLIFLPMCLVDLKENSRFQIIGLYVLLINCFIFGIYFMITGMTLDNAPWFGNPNQWNSMIGIILFNYTLSIAIPTWLRSKSPSVDIASMVHTSSSIATILYLIVGIWGALAIPNVSINILEAMTTGAYGVPMQISGSFFAFFVIGLDIPLFSVFARANLVGSGVCSRRTANILVVYIPWLVSWIFYQGEAIYTILAWGGIIFTGIVAYILPLVLALHMVNRNEKGSVNVYADVIKGDRAQKAQLSYYSYSSVI
eukprot:scaffold40115_cov58-Attheya_sp.AAC.8